MDDLDPVPADPAAPQVEAHLPPGVTRGPETVRAFRQVLGNTLVANVTASYLWFALTFWAYLETRSVMATAIIGGGYMLFTAVFGTFFGTLVDRHRKKQVMVISSTVTLVAYAASAGLWLLLGEDRLADWGSAWFWLFTGVILVGGVVESLRNIALSTTVTLLVPDDGRDKANGIILRPGHLVHDHQRLQRSERRAAGHRGGPSRSRVVLTGVALLHLLPITVPEVDPGAGGGRAALRLPRGDLRDHRGPGAGRADPLHDVRQGGLRRLHRADGPLRPGALQRRGVGHRPRCHGAGVRRRWRARRPVGLGANPVRTLLLVNLAIALLGMTFTVREWACSTSSASSSSWP